MNPQKERARNPPPPSRAYKKFNSVFVRRIRIFCAQSSISKTALKRISTIKNAEWLNGKAKIK
jgi:hypothetical protein